MLLFTRNLKIQMKIITILLNTHNIDKILKFDNSRL